jgi:hypothetical protein
MKRAKAQRIPVFVDPKRDDFRHYRGTTCVTPNLAELARAAKLPVVTDAGMMLVEVTAAPSRPLQLLPHGLRQRPGDVSFGMGRMLGASGCKIGADATCRQGCQVRLTAVNRRRRSLLWAGGRDYF